jgi:TorA maturation chaperone TorD
MGIYLLLARVFADKPDLDLLERVLRGGVEREMEELGFPLGLSEGVSLAEQARELGVEYTRLFVMPGEVSLRSSVHLGVKPEERRLMSDRAVEVKVLIEALGLELGESFRGLPDHLAVQLELLGRLVHAEGEAHARGDPLAGALLRQLQGRILAEHLLAWIGGFAEKLRQAARHPFYVGFAGLLCSWLEREAADLGPWPSGGGGWRSKADGEGEE